MTSLGILFLGMGLLLIVLGSIFVYGDRIPFLGRLPGDIRVQKKEF